VEPVEQGGATGPEDRVAGARHRSTPAREAAEQPSTEAPSTEQRSREPGRQGPGREGGAAASSREGGRRRRRAEPSREAGPPEGPEGRVGWWSRSTARHHDTEGWRRTGRVGRVADTSGRQAAVGAREAPRRPSGGRRRPAGARREVVKHEQGAGQHDARLAAGSNSSATPVGAGVRRWAEKTTLNIFSPNLKVGPGPPAPPCRSIPACKCVIAFLIVVVTSSWSPELLGLLLACITDEADGERLEQ
jgi:hypothetical protein